MVGVGPIVVVLEAGAFGEARTVEPMSPPTFAIVRIRQQPIDQFLPGFVKVLGRHYFIDLLRRGRQPNQVEVDPSHQGRAIGFGHRFYLCRFHLGQQEAVDRSATPSCLFYRRRLRMRKRNEGPILFVGFGNFLGLLFARRLGERTIIGAPRSIQAAMSLTAWSGNCAPPCGI